MSHASSFPLTRIIVVDDHGIVRDGIRSLLRRQDGMDVVGLAATGEQAVLAAQRLRPDIIQLQGYLLARPGPPEDVQALLTSRWGMRHFQSQEAVSSRA